MNRFDLRHALWATLLYKFFVLTKSRTCRVKTKINVKRRNLATKLIKFSHPSYFCVIFWLKSRIITVLSTLLRALSHIYTIAVRLSIEIEIPKILKIDHMPLFFFFSHSVKFTKPNFGRKRKNFSWDYLAFCAFDAFSPANRQTFWRVLTVVGTRIAAKWPIYFACGPRSRLSLW